MIAVLFDPDGMQEEEHHTWWNDYRLRADEAMERAILDWENWLVRWQADPKIPPFSHGFRQPLWSSVKAWLYDNVFHKKCAYCESPLELDRYRGDAEHFRPKGRVLNGHSPTGRAMVRVEDREMEHPGYFWLAYEWRNLVPACSACNSGNAKVDRFPAGSECRLLVGLTVDEAANLADRPIESSLLPGLYYLGSRDLDRLERPMLLNPLNPPLDRLPREHLRFGIGGMVVAVNESPVGEHSIDVLKLDRDELSRRRQKAQEDIQRRYYAVLSDTGPDVQERLRRSLAEFLSGEAAYSAAALDYLEVLRSMQDAINRELFAERP